MFIGWKIYIQIVVASICGAVVIGVQCSKRRHLFDIKQKKGAIVMFCGTLYTYDVLYVEHVAMLSFPILLEFKDIWNSRTQLPCRKVQF